MTKNKTRLKLLASCLIWSPDSSTTLKCSSRRVYAMKCNGVGAIVVASDGER